MALYSGGHSLGPQRYSSASYSCWFIGINNRGRVNGYTAMHLLRSGNDVNMVSYWLGHADINTTHIYVEIDMEMKRQMLQKAGPPAVKEPLPWQKPNVLQWLNALAKAPQLCAANY
jgi:hypothetical protein